MAADESIELREGWELRTHCAGSRDTLHEVDLDALFRDDPLAHVLCHHCLQPLLTVTEAETREHLLHQVVSIEPFVIEEEPW